LFGTANGTFRRDRYSGGGARGMLSSSSAFGRRHNHGDTMTTTSDIQTFDTTGRPRATEVHDVEPDFIEREELRALLERGEPLVLLEALPERYFRKAHLPGARLMPHDRVAELAATLIGSPSSAVVVYCASETCRNSDQAAAELRRLGHSNVRVYRGGKADWQAAGLPVEGG
jgi:rhodanese-related sulfurtransferase